MTIMERLNDNIPEYSRYMYLEGYTPEQILAAVHRKLLREAKERMEAEEIPVVKIISEVRIKWPNRSGKRKNAERSSSLLWKKKSCGCWTKA